MNIPRDAAAADALNQLRHSSVQSLIVAFIVVALLTWIILRFWTKDWRWPVRTHTHHRMYALPAAVIWAGLVTAVSLLGTDMLLHHVNTSDEGLISSSGLLAAVLGTFFTIWTLLATVAIRAHQEQRIAEVPELLRRVNEVLSKSLHGAVDHIAKLKSDEESATELYLLDYDPGLGIRAAHREHVAFQRLLGQACQNPAVSVNAVFSPDTEIEEFHRMLRTPASDIEAIKRFIRSDLASAFVWRSPGVGPLHVIIIGNIAFQYIILPTGGDQSRTVGMRTEDAFLVAFLKDTVITTIRKAVTPSITRTGDMLMLQFARQPGVVEARIYALRDDKFPAQPVEAAKKDKHGMAMVAVPWPATQSETVSMEVPATQLEGMSFLRVVLVKKKNEKDEYSHPSNTVEIPARAEASESEMPTEQLHPPASRDVVDAKREGERSVQV